MSCKHPLKAFPIGTNPTGKTKYKITSYDIDFVSKNINTGQFICCKGKPVFLPGYVNIVEFIEIPCGQCIGCRLDYSKDWANRMMLELTEHDRACFVTLTYNDEHLPEPNQFIDDDGVISNSPVHPLVKRDLQLFLKRLRKHFNDDKIRYYACGEYGSENLRPHYHLILYGVDFKEDRYYWSNSMDNHFYRSPTLEKLWTYGNSLISNVTWDTCAYTARYVTKKLKGNDSEVYEKYNFPAEFCTMSRKPGIARNYYEAHSEEIYTNEEIFLSVKDGHRKIRPPRYYDKLFDIDNGEKLTILKDKRKEIAEDIKKAKMNLTSLSYLEQLSVEEDYLLARSKSLKRD